MKFVAILGEFFEYKSVLFLSAIRFYFLKIESYSYFFFFLFNVWQILFLLRIIGFEGSYAEE